MADIVIFGAGQIASVVVAYLQKFSQDRIVGFTLDDKFKTADEFLGLPLVAWEEIDRHFPPGQVKLLGPISYRRVNQFRRDRYIEGRARGYEFTSFIHPDSSVLTEEIGDNCFILEYNILQPFSKVGNNVVIWSANHIAHHVEIGDHCFIASHVGIAGAARIGQGCFLAGKAGVADNVVIGDDCFIGPATVILRNVPAGSVIPGKTSEAAPYGVERLRRIF